MKDFYGHISLLSKRERQLAICLAAGLSNKMIAYNLEITEGTVKEYMHRAFRKFGINRVQFGILGFIILEKCRE